MEPHGGELERVRVRVRERGCLPKKLEKNFAEGAISGLTNCKERADALSAGDLFYVPNKRCRNGHLSKRYVSFGGCYECLRNGLYGGKSALGVDEINNSVATCVYIFSAGEFVKVGIAEDVSKRLSVARTNCPMPVRLVYSTAPMPRLLARKVEALCHFHFAEFSAEGEWFRVSSEAAQAEVSRIVVEVCDGVS